MKKSRDLVKTNVYSNSLGDRLLIFGSCIEDDNPEILDNLSKNMTPLNVCLEEVHLNTVVEKIAAMLMKSKVKEISVVTKDGSPHCIGLHFAVEWAKKLTKCDDLKVNYYVIEHGKLYEISPEEVKIARHLSKIKKLI